MPSTNYEGLSYPYHLLNSGGSVSRNDFLGYRTKQATLFAQQNDIYALFATYEAKHMLNRHFSCSCSDIIYNKSIKKNQRKSTFLKVYFFSISQHFPNVKV